MHALYGVEGIFQGFVVAYVCNDYIAASAGRCTGNGYEALREVVYAGVVFGRYKEGDIGVDGQCIVGGGEPFGLFRVEQVGFVEDCDEVFAGTERSDALCHGCDFGGRIGAVDEPYYDIRLPQLVECALDAHRLYGVVRVAYAGRVDEAELHAADDDDVFYHIAGGAVYVAYEGFLVVRQQVEQGRFAGVRFAHDGGGDAVFDGVAYGKRVGQLLQLAGNVVGEVLQAGAVGKLYVFFAEIEFELYKGDKFEQGVPEQREALDELAAPLVHGKTECGRGVGGYQVGYGFGLREVDASRCKGPAR